MSGSRTVLLVMRRELEARRRGAFVVMGASVFVAAGAMVLLGQVADRATTRLSGDEADIIVGTIGVVALFLGVVLTGQILLTGVAEEKNSRVVEVVLGTMRPRHLLTGKVLAIGFIGFAEVSITAAAIILTGELAGSFQFPAATMPAIVSVLIWFVLGYAFYSTIYGAAGALVRRYADASGAAAPINLSMAIGYGIGVVSAGAGENPVLRVASMVPFTAPFTMPVRLIRGTADAWEVALSIALIVAGSYGLIRLGGRIYAGALLRAGKVRWREAWRAAGELH